MIGSGDVEDERSRCFYGQEPQVESTEGGIFDFLRDHMREGETD